MAGARTKTSKPAIRNAEQLGFVLEATEESCQEFCNAAEKGASDLDLRLMICRAFEANGGSEGERESDEGRCYYLVKPDRQPVFWFNVDSLDRPRRKPNLSTRQLLATVRKLYQIPDVGRQPANGKPKKIAAAVDQVVGDVMLIDPNLVDPTPGQPRTEFDVDRLAESIKEKGQTSPALLRRTGERYEVLAGERRLRACLQLGRPVLARVIDLEDEDAAAELAARDNLEADPLKPIEQARAYRTTIDAGGYTQKQLGAMLGVDQGTISHYLGLLKLPENARQLIDSGRLGVYQARKLVPFADDTKYPADLAEAMVAAIIKAAGKTGDEIDHWTVSDEIEGVLQSRCRPLTGSYRPDPNRYGYERVEITAAKRKKFADELAPVTLPQDAGGDLVTFNLEKFAELQAEGVERRKQREAKNNAAPAADGKSATSPAELKARKQKAADQFKKRLYLWKISTLQELIAGRLTQSISSVTTAGVEPVDTADPWLLTRLLIYFTAAGRMGEHRGQLLKAIGAKPHRSSAKDTWLALESVARPSELVAALVSEWIRGDVTAPWASGITCEQVEAIAETLGIDLAGTDWQLTREFLELHKRDQLEKLASDWRIDIPPKAKRADLIDALIADDVETARPAPLYVSNARKPKGGL